jgi:PAS domain S-box-containing protein
MSLVDLPGSAIPPLDLALLDQLPAAVYCCDAPHGTIRWFNRLAADLWGRAPVAGDADERFCGSLRLFHPDGTPLAHADTPMASVLRGGEAVQGQEVMVERPDGSRITVSVHISPILDAMCRVTGAVNVFHDVTARKRAQAVERLIEGQHLALEQLVDGAPLQAVLETLERTIEAHADGRLTATLRLAGEPAPDARSPVCLTVPVATRDGRVLATFAAWSNDARPPADTDRQALEWLSRTAGIAIEQHHGEVERARLLDEARRASMTAEAAKRRYRDLVNSLDAIVWESDAGTFAFSFVSRRAEDILGYPVETWLRDPGFWADHIHPDDRAWAVGYCQTHTAAGLDHTFEYRALAADGRAIWLRDVVRVACDEAGTPRTLYGVMVDITEQKRIEADREQLLARAEHARQQAESASRLKDEFLAVLSHELRTPINAILGWARMLREGIVEAGRTTQAIETIERNARSQAQLIEGLLDLSGIVSGKLRLESGRVDLAAAAQAAVDAVRPGAVGKGLVLGLDVPPGPVGLWADAARLQQIIWNLLANAVKFTPAPGRVDILVRADEVHASIVVRDTGDGIDPAFLPHVFDRFRQADSSTGRAHGGLGLGLAIVRELVEAHGGTVTAESAGRGQGATFTVRLPLALAGAPASALPLAPAGTTVPAGTGVSLQDLHVVAVDDDPDALELLVFTLRRHGATVTPATSAAEAFGALEAGGVDVVVTDIGMPREDGYALVRALRAGRYHQTPALAVTAYASVTDRQRARAAGFDRHIAKPYDPGELVRAVEAIARVRQRT